jgi:hypothetical protein
MAATASTADGGTSDAPETVFRPKARRAFLLILAISAIFVACVEAVLYATGRLAYSGYGWAFLLGIWLLWSAIYTFIVCRQFVIAISDTLVTGRISGLGNWGWDQQSILLADLDLTRSAKRGWANRVFGNQRFYSLSGQSIYFLRAAFSKEDVRKILNLLTIRD